MINTFLTTLSTLFDARFWIAFWAPAFVGVALVGLLKATQVSLPTIAAWWDTQTATQQVMTGLALLLGITIVAYILQALDFWLVRQYEGYWPWWLAWLRRWAQTVQRARKQHKTNAEPGAYTGFPDDALVMPTALGNTIRAAEDYPRIMYQLDAIAWWPRLVEVLPPDFRNRVDDAFTPIVALLNLCTFFWLWALIGGWWLYRFEPRVWPLAVVFGGGLLAAWICYRAAVDAAQHYADLIRVAFDCYRHDLLKKLHLPVPDNLQAEWVTWHTLTQFHLYYIYPWDQSAAAADTPFYYDTHQPTAPDRPQQLNIKLQIVNRPPFTQRRGRKRL